MLGAGGVGGGGWCTFGIMIISQRSRWGTGMENDIWGVKYLVTQIKQREANETPKKIPS